MRIAVVSPVRNAGPLIAATIRSLLDQTAIRSGRVHLHYVLQDGASTDDTVAQAEAVLRDAPGNVTYEVRSAPDEGMYDALATAFTRIAESEAAPDWFAYLNAGDLYAPTCFDTIADVAEQTDTEWLCGLHAYFTAHGTLVHTRLPARFKRDLIRAGAYGRGLPTIQQESTFWSASLHRTIDLEQLRTYRLAGDAFLWWTFAARTEPTIIQALLGGFTYHGGHLGTSKDDYRQEIERFAGPLTTAARIHVPAQLALWEQPARIKARLNSGLFLFNTTTGGWASQRQRITPTLA